MKASILQKLRNNFIKNIRIIVLMLTLWFLWQISVKR